MRRKSFRSAAGTDRDILADISFELAASAVTALVAPSGAGKTTLLRIMAGLDRDFEGHVASAVHRLGFVFQEPRLLPWRSVEDNLRIAAPRATMAELDALLRIFHLDQHRHHYPRELSLGLARRVAIARALTVRPDLLLLDEPFVSLDEKLAGELRRELIAFVVEHHITTVMVTHDILEAVQLAERVLLLEGHPARIIADYPIPTPRSERSSSFLSEMAERIRSRGLGVPPQT